MATLGNLPQPSVLVPTAGELMPGRVKTYLQTLLPKPQRLNVLTWPYSIRQRVPPGLTVCRGLLGLLVLWCLWGFQTSHYLAAAILCTVAGLTDALDGPLARRWNTVSPQWGTWDLLADKLAVLLPLLGLTWQGITPAWVMGVVVGREIGVAGLRWKWGKDHPLLPDGLGKAKTLVLFAAMVWLLTSSHLRTSETLLSEPSWTLLTPLTTWTWWILLAAVGLTVLSGLNYLRRVISPPIQPPGPPSPFH